MSRRFMLLGGDLLSAAQRILAPQSICILGRTSECDLVVKHATVSRRHAALTVRADFVAVEDLGSRNGTFVNGRQITTASVLDGQQLRFGEATFTLSLRRFPGDDDDSSDCVTPKCHPASAWSNGAVTVLSAAEEKVFALLLRGLSDKDIADGLRLSPNTVHNHVKEIFRAFKVHSRAELLARVLKRS